MPLLAYSWESLVALVVILLLSGLSNWLQRRRKQPGEPGEEEATPLPPLRREELPPAESGPRQPAFDLERELRRLFGEEPQPPPPPPPPVVMTAPETPPPAPALARAEEGESWESAPRPPGEPTPLTEAAAAYQSASALDVLAQARMEAAKALAERPPPATVARLRTAAPEIEALRAALQSPRTARQAVLAAIILGTPRALEETPSELWLRS